MMARMTLAVGMFLLSITAASAAETGPAPMQPQPHNTPRIASPQGPVYSLGIPSLQRPPIHNPHGLFTPHSAHPAPSTPGWTGYGFGGVPTYQWGYFGARYHPVKIYHRGYYGHRMSHGYRRGY